MNKEQIQKLLKALPKELKQKLITKAKAGKKIRIKIRRKKKTTQPSPYQHE